jgi:hypothetical protein
MDHTTRMAYAGIAAVAGTVTMIFVLLSVRSGRVQGGRGIVRNWIYRDKNPIHFWMSVGFTAAFGIFMYGAAFWLIAHR